MVRTVGSGRLGLAEMDALNTDKSFFQKSVPLLFLACITKTCLFVEYNLNVSLPGNTNAELIDYSFITIISDT